MLDGHSIENFKTELTHICWNDVISCNNVNDAYDLFLNKFSVLFNNHCPLKRFKIKQIPNKPWLISGIKNAIKKKNNMYKVFLNVDIRIIRIS